MEATYHNFESNLRDTISAAQHSGARVIVATVGTNLKDCAPFGSMHRQGLSPDALHSWDALVGQGSDKENAKDYTRALQAYRAAAQIDDQYAELEFRIARAFWNQGDYRGADQHFRRARDLDTLRFRADSEINDINRSVTRSSGAELVDADEIFAQESPNGITGSELIYEHVHMTPEGNYILARAMFEEIVRNSGKERPDPAISKTGEAASAVLSQAECDQRLALTAHDRMRLAREMLERLEKPPFTNQLNHGEQVLRLTFAASGPDENPDETASEYQWAIRRRPDDRILHYNFGLFLFDYNRAAAAEQLRMARPWDDFPVFAPDGTPLG
jgi:tetratricopeptide (TPR) repeat protein